MSYRLYIVMELYYIQIYTVYIVMCICIGVPINTNYAMVDSQKYFFCR